MRLHAIVASCPRNTSAPLGILFEGMQARYINIKVNVFFERECAINAKSQRNSSILSMTLAFWFICSLLSLLLLNCEVIPGVVSYETLVMEKKELAIKSCVYRFLLW